MHTPNRRGPWLAGCRLAGTALLAAALATASLAMPIEVGQPFPDQRWLDLDGVERSIADYRGSKVVLHVFASW